jgi:hypothetical protein
VPFIRLLIFPLLPPATNQHSAAYFFYMNTPENTRAPRAKREKPEPAPISQ